MNYFCWNVRGFNKSSYRSGFKYWIRHNKYLFGSLLETHVRQGKQHKLVNAVLPGWSFDNNYSFSELEKIWVLWHPSVKVEVFYKFLQMISCEITLPTLISPLIVSFVYASTDKALRRHLWNELITLSEDHRLIGKPWTVLGDFNQVLRPEENSAATTLNVDLPTRLFAEATLQAGLVDLSFRGSSNTWWNKRCNDLIAKKLDRVMVNDECIL
ncbi:hypothetical protein N665_1036s0004 [Sinapis alba]|nr:hypothetical protein N665_1036s0004 [Sinapis alba]